MGLGDWLASVGRSATQVIDDAGRAVGHGIGTAVGDGYSFITGDTAGGQRITNSIDSASDAIFFDGTVAGTNPAQIYKWFNEGPGTSSYGTARDDCGSLHTTLAQYATHFGQANAALQAGWTGEAGATALQNVSPSQTIAEALAERANVKQGAYSGQTSVFDDTKHKVVKLPDNPPPPNNPLSMDPISTATDTATAAAYQGGTKINQQAYTSYQPPTQTHMATIPQGDTTVSTGQSNDSGSSTQQGSGISEPRNYSPSFGSGHSSSSGPGTSQGGGTQVTPPHVGPGGSQQGGSPGGPGSAGTGTSGGDASTNLAGYQAPPTTGSGGWPGPGSYDGGASRQGGGGFDGGAGSVFGGSSGAFGGAGVGNSGGGARGAALGAGNASGTGAGTGADAMGGRAGALGARGAAGQAGAGGAGAGGRGGKREEDKEHKTAAYLINEDNGSEVVGDLPPSLPAGGVIGG